MKILPVIPLDRGPLQAISFPLSKLSLLRQLAGPLPTVHPPMYNHGQPSDLVFFFFFFYHNEGTKL